MTATGTGTGTGTETVAVVVVTYDRADLLEGMLDGLRRQDRLPDCVLVVDNASTDRTAEVLAAALDRDDLPLEVVTSPTNTGGAGGFHTGLRAAYDRGFDRFWLMDDDVVPDPSCLRVLMEADADCLMAVREDRGGRLCEKAALRFDLRDPRALKPKTAMVETTYGTREAMPERVELENVAFEGFMVRRRVVERIGLPDASYFIFYDDVDYALRARQAGFRIWAVRDAVLVRQLDFDQQHDLGGGRATTCTATSSWSTCATARTPRCGPSRGWWRPGWSPSARCGAGGPRRATCSVACVTRAGCARGHRRP